MIKYLQVTDIEIGISSISDGTNEKIDLFFNHLKEYAKVKYSNGKVKILQRLKS